MINCTHEFETDGEEIYTQLDMIVRMTKLVRCSKCGQLGVDVFVYIGTYPRDEIEGGK